MAELTKAIARLMNDRESAPRPSPNRHRTLFERLGDRAPAERGALEAFAALLLERMTSDFIERANQDALLAMCASAYRFVAQAAPEPRVRVFNPTLERDGWDAPITVVETLMDDRPFIVDTVRNVLQGSGCVVRLFLHPVLGCDRDPQRTLRAVTRPEEQGTHESLVHVEIERLRESAALGELENELTERLRALLLATDDYRAMRRATEALAEELRRSDTWPSEPPAEEVAAFLEWLGQGNFVYLGYRGYRIAGGSTDPVVEIEPDSGLGLLRQGRSRFQGRPKLRALPAPMQRRILDSPALVVTKTTAESPIHRAARMDSIAVRSYGVDNRVTAERRLIGLFTSHAYAEEAATVPLLRRKLRAILSAEGAVEGSHDYKAIVSLFHSIPVEHLLALSSDDLQHDIRTIQAAESSDEVHVSVHPDGLDRGVYVLASIPRERLSADLRRRLETTLQQVYGGTVLDSHTVVDESSQARLHHYLAAPATAIAAVQPDEMRYKVRELLRTWDDRLRDALAPAAEPGRARILAQRYTAVFPAEYKAGTDEATAVRDISRIETLVAAREPQIDLANAPDSRFTRLKLYLLNDTVVLSDFLPVLENLGLRVFAQHSLELSLPEGDTVHINAFQVQRCDGERLPLDRIGSLVGAAVLAHCRGRLANDRLNSLISTAGLSYEHVDVLRAFVHHLAQTGAATREAGVAALANHPETARLLWECFDTKFTPADTRPPRARLTEVLEPLEAKIVASLDAVETLRDDGILRGLLATLAATVRTSFYSPREDGTLALKLESKRIPHLPQPRPAYEIFVHAPHVEGVHLRADKVARGGIRLTDRPDDYRTEILGLMKTQMAKNAVIVPTGAKGGFLVRSAGAAAPEPGQVAAAYDTFIGGLLDVTDNLSEGRLVPAPGVRYDGPDPYLVVAADKGTATFSDRANELARVRGFWLGDAFASGGSHGYDHKKIGITARGAWESVRRHFREVGVSIDDDAVTVIGIGDMSGDVFGNGMLRSRHLHLRAAFNHRHIFLDPAPDAAVSFRERERLFQLPGSSWDSYDGNLLSSGGGVFSRNAKKIALSAEAMEMLGVSTSALTGNELVRAILCMDVDLLWNGGIGTYVKASTETHADAGDPANDGVRVDADRLRARVVGEGGNLGFTQRARVEYAIRGGRLNTDAIDNAGGVAMSDYEVNLKIALAPVVVAGEPSGAERNELLTRLTDDVTRLVLRQNVRQTLALSLERTRSQTRLADFLDLMRDLEAEGCLDRNLELLPDREALRRRRPSYLGLTRPELAVLLAHAKLSLQQKLLASSLPDEPYVERALYEYFPAALVEQHRGPLRRHRLRREIISVQLANRLIDIAGTTFVGCVRRDTGCGAIDVVRAWTVAAAIGDTESIYGRLLAPATPLSPEVEEEVVFRIEHALEAACKWLIQTQAPDTPTADLVGRFLSPVYELHADLPGVLLEGDRARLEADRAELIDRGLEPELANRVSGLRRLSELMEIVHLAGELGISARRAAEAYYRSGEIVDAEWMREHLSRCPAIDRWERRALVGLTEGLMYARRALTQAVLAGRGAEADDIDACLKEFTEANADQIGVVRNLVDDIKSAPETTLAALLVLMRETGRLCDGARRRAAEGST